MIEQPGTPVWIEYDHLMPAPYNPNVMTPEEIEKERRSIRELGFISPIITRDGPRKGYHWIVNGEHRRDVGHELGMTVFPCWNLGEVADDVAMEMTLVLNGLHGSPDPTKLKDLLDELRQGHDLEDLIALLPLPDLEALSNTPSPLPELPIADVEPRSGPPPDIPDWAGDGWVERVFRLPRSAAQVVDEAFIKIREDDPDMVDWQCLEAIAADYMGT